MKKGLNNLKKDIIDLFALDTYELSEMLNKLEKQAKKEVFDDFESEIMKYTVNEFPSVVRMTKILVELKKKHLGEK
jgi:hypothetical protein